MAPSRLRPDTVWMINDGGHGPRLHAVDRQGGYLGHTDVRQLRNRDWEDLASFVWRGRSYLAIADIGDNRARRPDVQIHLVPEPRFRDGQVAETRVAPFRTISFTYPSGPRDAEGLAVDLPRQRFLILSKRESVPEFYEVPLGLGTERGPFVAKPIAPWRSPSIIGRLFARSPDSAPFISQMPTALDLTPDGHQLLILDYTRAWWIPQVAPNLRALQPVPLPRHGLEQAEAACFSADGKEIWITTEGRPTPWLIYALPPTSR